MKLFPLRLRAHPLIFLLPLLAVALGMGREAAALSVSLFFHECAHLVMARALGVRVEELRLMPFGGAIGVGNPYALSPARLLGIAAAGPLANLGIVILCAALCHWGIVQTPHALLFFRVNLTILLFNLLPALPLDGGRMLYALLMPWLGRDRAVAVGVWMGRVVAVALIVAALWGAFACGRFNLSPAAAAVFILSSAGEERRALGEAGMRAMLGALRPVRGAYDAKLCAVGTDCPLPVALRAADPSSPTLYAVYDADRFIGLIDERALLDAALRGARLVGEGLQPGHNEREADASSAERR